MTDAQIKRIIVTHKNDTALDEAGRSTVLCTLLQMFCEHIATNSAQFNFNEQEDSGADRSYYYFPCFINSEL